MARSLTAMLVAVAAACPACGDDASSAPDAGADSQLVDARPSTPGCDYAEADDTGNDDVTQDGTPELTGVTLGAAAPAVLCGHVSADHYDASDDTVDVDGYTVQLPAGPLLVTLSGAGLETLGEAKLGVYSGDGFATVEAEEPVVGSHAVVMLDLPAGAYEFAVLAENGAELTAAIPYKIRIGVDTPAARCPKITGAANHTEGTAPNDVVAITVGAGVTTELTAAGNDAPEASGITLLPQTIGRITGGIAASGSAGSYKDPDTYTFTTGPAVDEVTIRLSWTGTADLDWFLFAGGVPAVAASATDATTEDELRTVAVRPNTTYWLWTGMYEDSTAPMAYDLSLCGETFAPP